MFRLNNILLLLFFRVSSFASLSLVFGQSLKVSFYHFFIAPRKGL